MKTVLYLLKFQDTNILKIGISKNIVFRISKLEKEADLIVDHYKSMVVTNPKASNLNLLEKNLLNFTKDFKYHFPNDRKFAGIHEFRTDNCLNLINQFIVDQGVYGLKYKVYTGIDICGNYNTELPKVYFPIFDSRKEISFVLRQDIYNYCQEKGLDFHVFINNALFRAMKSIGIDRKDEKPIKDYKKFFKV